MHRLVFFFDNSNFSETYQTKAKAGSVSAADVPQVSIFKSKN